MKAILPAGGEGTRLRPLSGLRPKPMVRLFDRPVLEHSVELLKRHGITDLTMTLQTLPQTVIDHFGDGADWGVHINYMVEQTPLGTAGSTRACRGLLDEDDSFLIFSGDAVCDFDLSAAIRAHRRTEADVTLLLYRADALLDYGLVLLDRQGRVTRFVEKPGWNQVFADTVNTGIYLMKTKVLDHIPEGRFCDFAQDLFPKLLRGGAKLYGFLPEGYWCDMGDGAAYRRACFDALDGAVALRMDGAGQPGLWLNSPVPKDAVLRPPCYVGRHVRIGARAVLGPYAVLGEGTVLGGGAQVVRSVADGARCMDGARLDGAIVAQGALVREGASLREGSMAGEQCVIGRHAVLSENAKLWPHKQVEDDAVVTGAVTHGAELRVPAFDGHRLSGPPDAELNPAFCARLGAAAAELYPGEIALGLSGGAAAQVAAQALEVGVRAAGGAVVRHDAAFAACAAYVSQLYGFSHGFFVSEENGELTLSCFDADGLPPTREGERKLLAAALRGETRPRGASETGSARALTGLPERYAAAAAARAALGQPSGDKELTVRIPRGTAAAEALTRAAGLVGIRVQDVPGAAAFIVSPDGFGMEARDEAGRLVPQERLLGLLLRLTRERGAVAAAVRYAAPVALDALGGALSMRVLREPRDGAAARRLSARQWELRDAVFGLLALMTALKRRDVTLSRMNDGMAPFAQFAAEASLRSDRGSVMRALGGTLAEKELYEGLRGALGGGWVHVSPLSNRRALRVVAEGASMEAAEEICGKCIQRIKTLDKIEGL